MYIGKTPTVGNFQVCDAISVVNGQAAYTLQVGGTNVAPESANHMLVSLNGILQKPGSSFTISGSTMTFASNLATGDVIDFVQILGNVLDLGTPSDSTVTSAKLVYPLTTFSSTGIDDNASANSITIDTNGHVTMPLQSAVHAYPTSAQDDMATGIVTIVLGGELYDVNSDFNTSTSTFTAPVTGKYQVNASVSLTDVDTAFQWMYGILLVASNRNYYMQQIDPRIEISADGLRQFNASTLVDMDANDTLLLKTRSSSHGAAQHNVTIGSTSAPETFLTVHLAC